MKWNARIVHDDDDDDDDPEYRSSLFTEDEHIRNKKNIKLVCTVFCLSLSLSAFSIFTFIIIKRTETIEENKMLKMKVSSSSSSSFFIFISSKKFLIHSFSFPSHSSHNIS